MYAIQASHLVSDDTNLFVHANFILRPNDFSATEHFNLPNVVSSMCGTDDDVVALEVIIFD